MFEIKRFVDKPLSLRVYACDLRHDQLKKMLVYDDLVTAECQARNGNFAPLLDLLISESQAIINRHRGGVFCVMAHELIEELRSYEDDDVDSPGNEQVTVSDFLDMERLVASMRDRVAWEFLDGNGAMVYRTLSRLFVDDIADALASRVATRTVGKSGQRSRLKKR